MPDHDPSQATSSHMMKVTKRGRPFLKDTLDLFATLIVSLRLQPQKQYFKTFQNAFTTDDAAANLASLKFSQSNRGPDPREPSRVVTTTTTTTFSMTRDMAKAMCQHFMDARLIENAADPSSNLFKERGVYILTPKGLHVLERFISKNGINSDPLQAVFATQPICIRLMHLERRHADDEIIITPSVVNAVFRRFVGRSANYPSNPLPTNVFEEYHERSKGVPMSEIADRQQSLVGRSTVVNHKYCFAAVTALEWLCDFTSVVGREEAAEMAAQFVRFGLIALVSDKRKNNDSAIIFTVRGTTPGGNSPIAPVGEFRCTAKAIYKVTEEGVRVAHWDGSDSPSSSTANLHTQRSSTDEEKKGNSKLHRRVSVAGGLDGAYEAEKAKIKESHTDRLKYILEEPTLRSLFREHLRNDFCEENLAFWLAVQDFRRRFQTTSSAAAVNATEPTSKKSNAKTTPGQAAMERHHEQLIQTACDIYNTYLARSSPSELNIDHALRLELAEYLGSVLSGITGKTYNGRLEVEQANTFNATQLQSLIRLYERIQSHVFRLMATDSVPKFIKTPKFLSMRRNRDDEWDIFDLATPPGLDEEADSTEEHGGFYMTVSPQATEQRREHRNQQDQQH